MYEVKYKNFIFFCRTESQEYHARTGRTEPFKGDLDIIKKIIKSHDKNNIFVDIGANIGTYSISLSPYFKKIFSFEPEQENFELLKKNVSVNNCSNIRCDNTAILDKEGSFLLSNHNKSPGIHEGTYFIELKEGNTKCDLLKNCIPEDDLNKISVIKLDTEGSELLILKNIKPILEKIKPVLCIEINICSEKNYGIKQQEIRNFISSVGYTLYKQNGSNYYYV